MRVLWVVALAGCGRIGFDAATADALVPPSDAQAAIPPGAKVWLQMETDPTAGIVDSAGGHTCFCNTATGCPSRVPSIHGSGYSFVNKAIQIDDTADLDLSAGFTAAAWVNLDGYPSSNLASLFARPTSATNDTFVLAVSPDMRSTFDFEDAGGATHSFEGPQLPVASWHHMAWVSTGAQTIGYVDGSAVGSAQAAGADGSAAFLFVGADDLPSSFFLAGALDDVVLYTRALSQAEITKLATP